MLELGTNPVLVELLGRANSLSLTSPVDGGCGFGGYREWTQAECENHDHTQPDNKGRRAYTRVFAGGSTEGQAKKMEDYGNHSDAASDNSMNPVMLRNDRYAVLTRGELATTDSRTFSTGSTRRVGNPPGSVSSSTFTVIRQPVNSMRGGSVHSGELSPLSRDTAYPVIQAHERYRGTSYTLDSGFVGPRTLSMDSGGEGLGLNSAGLSIRTSTGTETAPLRGKLPGRGTYRAPDGNYNTSRTDQDRRPSSGRQYQASSRRVQSGPPPRSSSQSFPATQHHQMHGRGYSSGSLYTYGLGGHTNQGTLLNEGIWSTEDPYGSVSRHSVSRSRLSGRQPWSGSVSDGVVRDTRPRVVEHYRQSLGNREYASSETGNNTRHQGQQFQDRSSSVSERRVNSNDQRYRRPQSRAESFQDMRVRPGTRGQNVEEPPEEISADEQLAQKARELLNRARAIPQPVSSPEEPVGSDVSEPWLDGIAQMIEHISLPGAVDIEEVPNAANVPTSVMAPKLDTTKSLHWSRSEFPEDDSPQSPVGSGDTRSVPDLKRVEPCPTGGDRFSLNIDDLPESNLTVYNPAHEGSANRSERRSSPGNAHEEKLLEKGYIPNIWLAASDSPLVGKFSGRPRPRLVENDNPHVPSSDLPGSTANESVRSREMNIEAEEME